MPSALLITQLEIGTKQNEKQNENGNFVKDIREAFAAGIRLKDIIPLS
jgi:hypothetical protein